MATRRWKWTITLLATRQLPTLSSSVRRQHRSRRANPILRARQYQITGLHQSEDLLFLKMFQIARTWRWTVMDPDRWTAELLAFDSEPPICRQTTSSKITLRLTGLPACLRTWKWFNLAFGILLGISLVVTTFIRQIYKPAVSRCVSWSSWKSPV